MLLEKLIKYLLYISLFLPLVFVNYTMYPWNFGKTVYFQILIDILIILSVTYFSLGRTVLPKSREGLSFPRFILLDWLVLAFLASQIISAFLGVNFDKSFWSDQSRATGVFTWIHFTVFYFLLRQFLTSKLDWINAGSLVVFVGLLSSIVAWIGKYTHIFDGVIGYGGRITGVI